jgi:hypothetical protein
MIEFRVLGAKFTLLLCWITFTGRLNAVLNSCEFLDLDILIPVGRGDLELFGQAINSLNEFMPCYHHLHVFVDENNTDLHNWWSTVSASTSIHILNSTNYITGVDMAEMGGYLLQQWIMFWSDVYAPASKFIMLLDTDVVFGLPITRSTLFDSDGKPYISSWQPTFQTRFVDTCEYLLGNYCASRLSYMAFFPFIVPTAIFKPLRAAVVQQVTAKDDPLLFDTTLLDVYKKSPKVFSHGFSQFFIIGNFVHNVFPEKAHLIHAAHLSSLNSTMECRYWVPPAMHWWYYSMYLGTEVSHDYFVRKPRGQKYSVHYQRMADAVVAKGKCLKLYWEKDKAQQDYNRVGGGAYGHATTAPSTADNNNAPSLPLSQCGGGAATLDVHPLLKLYPHLPFDMEYYKQHYYLGNTSYKIH